MSSKHLSPLLRACASTALALCCVAGSRAIAAPLMTCVDSDDAFRAAIVQATLVPTTIELVQGTYHVDGSQFDDAGTCGGSCRVVLGGFSLLGGYAAGCASRTIDAANTVVTSTLPSSSFTVRAQGDVTIEGVKVTGISAGAAVVWNHYVSNVQDNVQAIIRRNIFAGNLEFQALDVAWFPDGDQSLTARVVNNLVHDNTLGGGTGSCAVSLTTDPGDDAVFDLINNTIVDNTGSGDGVCMGYPGGSGGSLSGYDNIMYGNSGVDLRTYNGTNALLVDNVIGTHSYQGLATAIGTQTGDPKLNAAFHPITAPVSPVINSGNNAVPGGLPSHDLDGGPRLVGTTVDRGAFESSIDDAFIQTVSNNNDSGTGSLRQAIINANAAGSTGALITFDIGSGCGPHVITLESNLPAITVPLIVNGYSQTGASENTLDVGDDASICVIVESGNASVTHGLYVAANAGDGVQVTVDGLAFSGFNAGYASGGGAPIVFAGGAAHGIGGNHFGGTVNGYALQSNLIDVRLGVAAHGVLVGGADAAARNIIGDAIQSGIEIDGSASAQLLVGSYDDQVVNNYIGVGWNRNNASYTNRANHGGILLLGHDNTLSGNLIGDNVADAIALDGGGAVNNVIAGNFIGADAAGSALGNWQGVHFTGATGDAPHDNTVRANTIANNANPSQLGSGIRIEIGARNKLRKNAIYANGELGIDLAGAGVTPNDDDGGLQSNDYANRGQNFPSLTGASGGSNSGSVSGTLTTTPGSYTIDFYSNSGCDASGHGEGQIWLKGMAVDVPPPPFGDQGTANFSATISLPLLARRSITATATDAAGDTSEFSACITYTDDTIFADGFEPPPA